MLDTIDEVIEAGARRVCVVRAITQASDPQDAAQQLRRRLQAAWNADPAMERYTMQALAGAGPARAEALERLRSPDVRRPRPGRSDRPDPPR